MTNMTVLTVRSANLCWFFVLLFAAMLGASYTVLAQSSAASGRIEGTIVDASGALIPSASITAQSLTTKTSATQQSDSTGHFGFLSVTPGHYDVSIEKSGFKSTIIHDVVVNVGTTTTLRPQLAVGEMETKVTVTAETLVDLTQSALATVIDRQNIDALPLNGRNFTDFALLTPGATTDGDGMVSFNGIAGNFNNYSVDGGNNNNAFFAQQIGRTSIPFQFSEDVIQEFQVTSSGFEAEFGQAGGGLVNSVTRSGVNNLHGDGYYYILDSALNANDPINKSLGIAKPANRRQQFGGTIGGPIHHDRIFYLANYEGQIRNEPLTVNNSAALVGLPDGFLAANPDLAAQVNAASGSFSRSFNQNAAFGKINAVLNSKNTLDGTYNYQRYRSPHGYFSTPTSTGDGLSLTDGSTSHFFQVSLHTIFNAKTVNELRFHFGSDLHFDLPDTPATGPAIVIQNPDTGFVFGGNRFQLSTSDHRYEFTDNLTKVIGRHTFKAGVDINYNRDTDYFVYAPKGEYQFASLADVATGSFQLYLQSFGQSTIPIHSPTFAVFAQDSFRLNPKLTVNYGLRYDLQILPTPTVCNPDLSLTCHISYSKNNVAPRAGFAYSPFANSSTVVRGSFGLFYMQEDLLDVSQTLASNGISRPFLATTGPGFGNNNPIVSFPTSLTAFPSGAGGTPSAVVFSPNFRSPYVEQGSLAVEHQFGAHTALSVAYAYSHGLALLGNSNGVTRQANGNFGYDLNLVPPSLQVQAGGNFTEDQVIFPDGHSAIVPDYEAIDGNYNPNFGTINVIDNTGHSRYNGLLVSLRHTSSQYFATAAYTLSKAADQGTGYYNQFDQKSQSGRSLLDQRHRFVLSAGWTPTTGIVRGFILSGVLNQSTGRPYTAVFDSAQPNFSVVPGEGFNSFTGPGTTNLDLSLARDLHLNDRFTLRLRAESFDLFNHANYADNVNNIQYTTTQQSDANGNSTNVWVAAVNPTFGTPLASTPRSGSRSFQFSTKLSF
ncbi:MAG TPA: TonB-dependent receptor [Edaphobacter sp.]|nr:TonB-dependent receptor [Edaphobacter sp.]